MIEIYISNKKLDLIDDIDVNFTYSSIDTQNPSAVKNSFSKTVSVPSTPNNDEIFGHIWRFDSYITSSNPNNYTGVYFDPHKRTPFYIMKNGAVVENGYCVLESISMKENEKTYNLNLFGGLGEFFFNLMYDEDGKEKNLTDLYWKWIPYRSYNTVDWESDPLTPDEENSQLLYRLNSANVCAAWPMFDPNDNLAYDSKSFICSDVMFVPMYYGHNNDFISNKILVNNYQRNNSGDTGTTISSNWNSFLPVQYQEDDDTYELYEPDATNSYGLIDTPRDLDPTEARDFRVTNMPMVIRVSKLMNRISDPQNNGGYNVVWDQKIKDSYWWKYGFILTDTPEYDLDNIQEAEYDFSNMTLSDEYLYSINVTGTWDYNPTSEQTQTITSQASTTNMSQPKFALKVKPNITVKAHKNQNDASKVASLGSLCLSAQGNVLKSSNALCWLVDFYDNDDTLRYSYLCMAAFSNTGDHFGSNYYISNTSYANGYISSTNQMMSKVIAYVNTRFSRSLTNDNYTFIDSIPIKQTGSTPITNTFGVYYYYKVDNVDEHLKYTIDLPTTITDMKVKVTNFELNYYLEVNGSTISDYVLGRTSSELSTLYSKIGTLFGANNLVRFNFLSMFGYKVINESVGSGNYYKSFDYVSSTGDPHSIYITNYYGGSSVTSKYTTYLYEGAQLTSYLDIYKKTLLNNTKSPYKYLIDFAKLLNLRFLYDKNEKKITILPNGKYWINKTIDINDKVDVGREINIKHLFDKTKFIKFNLDTPDTWAETVYKKLSKYEYGEFIKDTGIQFNKESKNLLEGLIYSNSILWQNKSIYYDGNNIGRYFLPTPTNQNIFDWTLFKVDGDETKSLTRSQSGSNCIDTIDELPKIGSFDKDNKSVKVGTTFVFYNGLVKNFTLSDAQISSSLITLTPDSINESHYIPASGGTGSTQYQDIYIYNVEPDTKYYVTASNSSSYTSYIVNYYNANGVRIGTEYSQANANLSDAVLTLPSGTTQIRCNFRKADTNAKLKGLSSNSYVFSPYFTVSDNTRIQQQLAGGYCYYYGFKSDGVGFGTGAACTACSASWYVPYFSRDLYNTFKSSTSTWTQQTKLLASWDITEPENIMYDDSHLQFITNKDVYYTFPVSQSPYNFEDAKAYTKSSNSYIFGNFWKDFINDFYDRNSKEITCYCKIEEAPEVALRKFYSFRGSLWIMTKIENYKLNFYEDNFSKVTLHKIVNKDHYLYSNKLSLDEVQNVINQGTSSQQEL